ncbi:MAG: hypothetical protein U5R48_16950 [Gammaproteobacteria bacterium]|nr:hypothetical protein [Gammaproteobacteria bacterium]
MSLATLHAIAKQFNDGKPLGAPELVLVIRSVPQQFKETLLRPYAAPEANQTRLSVRMIESNRDLDRDAFLERVRTGITEELGIAAGPRADFHRA